MSALAIEVGAVADPTLRGGRGGRPYAQVHNCFLMGEMAEITNND